MTIADSDRPFEAPDLIEVMDEAVLYNRFLIRELDSWARDTRRLLDFGAGNGRFCVALLERGYDMHAVEPDPRLREKIGTKRIEARESLQSFEAAERMDGIYTINVLEHIEDDAAILRAFFERLVPGGRLFIYVPAFTLLFSANDRRVGHLRRYHRSQLVELVRRAGFDLERAEYVDSLGFFAGLAYRFVGNRDGDLNVTTGRLYDRVLFPISRLLDRFFRRVFGKNLLVTATRPR